MRIVRLVSIVLAISFVLGIGAIAASANSGEDYNLVYLYDSRTFYKDCTKYINNLANKYDGLLRVVSIGKSVEGRDIYDIAVGNADSDVKIAVNAEQTVYKLDMAPAKESRYIGGSADSGGCKDWLLLNNMPAVTIEVSEGSLEGKQVDWKKYGSIWKSNKDVPLEILSCFYK